MRWLGGIPIDRSKSAKVVDQMAEAFHHNNDLILAIAPEGTRTKVNQWRSGFYHIAHQAKVPIMLVVIDAERKEVRFAGYFSPTGSYEQDLPKILEPYKGIKGIVAKNSL